VVYAGSRRKCSRRRSEEEEEEEEEEMAVAVVFVAVFVSFFLYLCASGWRLWKSFGGFFFYSFVFHCFLITYMDRL
jgi:hypothetical protein